MSQKKKESMDSFKHYNNQPTSLLSIDLLKDRLMTSEKFCHLKESWVSNNSEKPLVKIEPKSKKSQRKKEKNTKNGKNNCQDSNKTTTSEKMLPKILRCKMCFISHFPMVQKCNRANNISSKIQIPEKLYNCS